MQYNLVRQFLDWQRCFPSGLAWNVCKSCRVPRCGCFSKNRGTKYPKMDDLFIIRKTLLRFGWFGGNTPVVDNILVTGCLEVSCHWRKHVTLVLETFWKPPRVANWSQAIHKPGVLFFFFNWRILFVYGGFLKWWVSPTNPWVFLS